MGDIIQGETLFKEILYVKNKVTMKPRTSLIAPSNVYSDQSFESWMKDGSHFDFIGQKREKLTLN